MYPNTAATAARLARPSLPAKILDEFVTMFKLGMRVKLEKWGPRYGPRIKTLAPRLQQHPKWPAYRAQVLHVATKIEQVVEHVTRNGMNPSHATTAAVELAFERQRERSGRLQQHHWNTLTPHLPAGDRRPRRLPLLMRRRASRHWGLALAPLLPREMWQCRWHLE